MRTSMTRAAANFACMLTILTLVASAFSNRTVEAQSPVPDIRGNYELYGTQTVSGCADVGGDFSSPLDGTLQITAQEGDQFSGTFGFPDQGIVFFGLSGTVNAAGGFEGTWSFPQTPGGVFSNPRVVGTIANGNADADFTADFGTQGVLCNYRASLASIAATLAWQAPDAASASDFPPPRALTLAENTPAKHSPTQFEIALAAAIGFPPEGSQRVFRQRDGMVTGYNIYRSSTPGVQPVPGNLFAQTPATQTSLPTGAAAGGSFFVVTAAYEGGESDPTNEVSGGLTPAVLTKVKVSASKIKATGNGFTATVQVFVDGIPFVGGATVKGGKKVTQRGALLTGQTLSQYLTPGKVVAISFRNADGAIATFVYTKP